MPSADFSYRIPIPRGIGSTVMHGMRPPRVRRYYLHAYVRHIYADTFMFRYWTLMWRDISSGTCASYVISVRRTSALPMSFLQTLPRDNALALG